MVGVARGGISNGLVRRRIEVSGMPITGDWLAPEDSELHVECGCGVDSTGDPGNERKAVGVDSELKTSNINHHRRIEGQVRGLQRMVQENRDCTGSMVELCSGQDARR